VLVHSFAVYDFWLCFSGVLSYCSFKGALPILDPLEMLSIKIDARSDV
jgi:hypothetical protein